MTDPGEVAEHEAKAALVENVQRAAGVIAARQRGDSAGAQALLVDFPGAEARTLGFFALAELAVALLCEATGEDAERVLQRISLDVAEAAHG